MLLISIIFLGVCGLKAEKLGPEVTLELGKVEGYYGRTINGNEYAAFEGIPYARPPVGKYRFREPIPAKPWKGTWKANVVHKCMQYNHYTEPGQDFVIGDEDCLYLNVYTPNLTSTTLLDVIVYIHGGAFMFNYGASYGPKYILDQSVVLVTLNYRLGPLGFLTTENSLVPGNNGIRDQLLALQWIKANIENFKGNPDSITLTGMSAGGASCHIHLISPLSEGLFHRGISQSGVSLNPWVLMENGLGKAKKLAVLVGCPANPLRDMIECMRYRPARQIVDNVKNFLHWLYNPFSPFGVVVDKFATEPILPDHPYKLLSQGKLKDLPWMFTSVGSEGLYPASDFLANANYLPELEANWDDLMTHVLDLNYTLPTQVKHDVLNNIKQFYFHGQPVSNQTFGNLVQLISDRLFLADIDTAVRLQKAATLSPVYYYHFTYRGAHSKSELRSHTDENFGAAHSDDTSYVLSSPYLDVHSTENDRRMAEILQDIWVTFAQTGRPLIKNVTWAPVSREQPELNYLHISSPDQIQMEAVEHLGNSPFWNSLNLKENNHLFLAKDEL